MIILEVSLSILLLSAGAALLRKLISISVQRRVHRQRAGSASYAKLDQDGTAALQDVLDFVNSAYCSGNSALLLNPSDR
jgi:hypothetical protein